LNDKLLRPASVKVAVTEEGSRGREPENGKRKTT
jgi:hypothetical protein